MDPSYHQMDNVGYDFRGFSKPTSLRGGPNGILGTILDLKFLANYFYYFSDT